MNMDVCLTIWILSLLMLKDITVEAFKITCDPSMSVVEKDGPMGESSTFPWLGVLKVNIHEENSLQMAMTGLVMVKLGYAIANADDISRIPKKIFLRDSLAMFIPEDGEAWYCMVQDYMTHGEYEKGVVNTIAILELTLVNDPTFPVKPICQPKYPFNTSNELYAVGYTDEGKVLEKFIHKIVYVPDQLCTEYYQRAGFSRSKIIPKHFHCGFALRVNRSCIWDNGMALISNATTGEWRLVGFGINGPGCAAPARFIDLQQYYPWINSVTDPRDMKASLRQSALNIGFKPRKSETEDIPIHDLLRHGLRHFKEYFEHHDDIIPGPMEFSHYYPFTTVPFGGVGPGQGKPGEGAGGAGGGAGGEGAGVGEGEGGTGGGAIDHFTVHRQEPSVLYVTNDDYSYPWGNCSIRNNFLIYKDYMKVVTSTSSSSGGPKLRGTAVYKLSMFDLYYLNYTCVKIKLFAINPENAYISYDIRMETSRRKQPPSGAAPSTGSYKESQFPNPPDIIKVYPIRPPGGWRPAGSSTNGTDASGTDEGGTAAGIADKIIRPQPHWKIETIEDDVTSYEHPNINIYLKLHFVDTGKLEVRVFGPPRFTFTAPTTNPARRSITWKTALKNSSERKLREGEESQSLTVANLRNVEKFFVDVSEGCTRKSEVFLVAGVSMLKLFLWGE